MKIRWMVWLIVFVHCDLYRCFKIPAAGDELFQPSFDRRQPAKLERMTL